MSATDILLKAKNAGVHLYLKEGQLAFKATNQSLTSELREEIAQHKETIIEYLQLLNSNVPDVRPLSLEEGPLSFAQNRLWLIDQIDPGNAQYHILTALRLDGVLQVDALTRALGDMIERHHVLRTTFSAASNGEPIQRIRSDLEFAITHVDLQHLPAGEQEAEALAYLDKESLQPFALATDLMIRVHLLKLSAQRHLLQVTLHHIASDGWSQGILVKELSTLYDSYLSGSENPIPELALQYLDYAYWQRDWLSGEVLERHLSHWTTQLEDLPAVHSLPLDRPRPAVRDAAGSSHQRCLSIGQTQALSAFAEHQGVTLFMLLNSVFSILLSRWSGETDIVVGTPVANRDQAELSPLVGFFVNTLILRTNLSGNPGFDEVLKQSKQYLLKALEYQQLPFERLVDELQPERSLSYTPLFQVMFSLQNQGLEELSLNGLELKIVDSPSLMEKFDITLNGSESPEGLRLHWGYSTALFESATIERMADHFESLLEQVLENPGAPIDELSLLTEQERRRLVERWNQTESAYSLDDTIDRLFERQVERDPLAVALLFEGAQMTYGELDVAANRVAQALIQRGVHDDKRVGLCVKRSLDMVIGLLGILKSGGAYVPLDPSLPSARLAYMLEDSGADVVLTQRDLVESISLTSQEVVLLEDCECQEHEERASDPAICRSDIPSKSQRLAYVMYTSGSTGQPKGVMIEHRSVVNFLHAMAKKPGMSPDDRMLAVTTYSFDISCLELFLPLITGAQVRLGSPEELGEMENLKQVIAHYRPTVMQATPATWQMLFQSGWENVEKVRVLCGGDALPQTLRQRFLELDVEAWNMFGPTETTVWSTVSRVTDEAIISIGKPIDNTQIYILDEHQNPQPVGIPGELYIGGDGLARGYLNRPELTQSVFIDNPYAKGTRLYRSGDRARWLSNGSIEFLGRLDNQVKIRGYRVETGEIESRLKEMSTVSDSVVVAHGQGDRKQLVAFYQTENTNDQEESTQSTNTMRTHLQQFLPHYMVPEVYVRVETIPLTANGKVNRRYLEQMDLELESDEVYQAPTNELEQQLVDIWAEVLDISPAKLGVNDRFFRLGGNSLLATKLFSKIHHQLSIEVPLKVLFECDTIVGIADFIQASEAMPVTEQSGSLEEEEFEELTL